MRLLLACCLAVSLSAAERTIHVFMYSEYIDPEIPLFFERETGIAVDIQVYEAQEEMVAKLRTGGSAQFDVIVASNTVIPQLIALKLIRPLDQTKLLNSVHIGKDFRGKAFDPTNAYTWPYLWGTTGVMYDAAKAKPPTAPMSWAWILDPAQQAGPVQLMDEMRAMLGLALVANGTDINSRDKEEIRAAAEKLITAKSSPKCLGFGGGVDGKNKVEAGEALAAVVYSGDAARSVAENANLRFEIPAEGGELWIDNLAITAEAPDVEGAHLFVNFLLSPEIAARNANYIQYPTPNEAALPLITGEDRANPVIYPDAATMSRLTVATDLDKDNKVYEAFWTQVKSR